MTWVKLQRFDDWGNIYLAPPDKGAPNGTTNVKYGVKFELAQIVIIRWPDGTLGSYPVSTRTEVQEVDDMGHSYTVASQVPGFIAQLHGLPTWISLDQVEVQFSGDTPLTLDADVVDETEFTCPKCGGHTYGSGQNPDGSWHRLCHGYLAGYAVQRNCPFFWPETDDHLYMKPTGRKHPRRGIAVMNEPGDKTP